MSWLSRFLGGKSHPETDAVMTTIQVMTHERPSTPKPKPKPKSASLARASAPSLGVDGWVGWNFCGQVDVAGIQHRRDAATKAFHTLKPGDLLELVRTPDNPHDTNSIEVRVNGIMVGFIDKDLAALVSELIPKDTPIRAEYASGHIGKTGFVRITILPLMPDVASRKRNGWQVVAK